METIELTIPAMFADHHVIKVKQLLSPIAGVEDVYASSAFKAVSVSFDPAKTSQAALVKALTAAGYAPGELEVVGPQGYGRFDPSWDTNNVRTTTTNQVDLQLSGEFRKY